MPKKQYIKSRKAAKVIFELPKAEWPESVRVEKAQVVGEFNDWHADGYVSGGLGQENCVVAAPAAGS